MSDPVMVVPYDLKWQEQFRQTAGVIRLALGELALRIDHIGSTAVPGLDAKPVIDIQISVGHLEAADFIPLLESIGYEYRANNPDRTKKYFREGPGMRRIHIHVREHGSWSEQAALLFRDYLRVHPADCREYANVKYRLMETYRNERSRYVEGKEPVIWELLRRANRWSQSVGWKPGAADM